MNCVFHQMLASGFEAEVRALLPEGVFAYGLAFHPVVWDTARCGAPIEGTKSHMMKWFIEVFAPRDS